MSGKSIVAALRIHSECCFHVLLLGESYPHRGGFYFFPCNLHENWPYTALASFCWTEPSRDTLLRDIKSWKGGNRLMPGKLSSKNVTNWKTRGHREKLRGRLAERSLEEKGGLVSFQHKHGETWENMKLPRSTAVDWNKASCIVFGENAELYL